MGRVNPKSLFTDKDMGWDKLVTAFKSNAGDETGYVGYPNSSAQYKPRGKRKGKAVTLSQLAAIHEFGGGNVPERSFMRSAIDSNAGKIKKLLEQLIAKMLAGKMKKRQALGILLEFVKQAMRNKILGGLSPGLSPATIAAREHGGTKPLLDTGQLLAGIQWEIKKGKG